MALPFDSAAKFQDYAHPEMLVSTDWLAEHLDDPGLVVAESDEDVLLYETGHIPGAVKLDWHTELNDPVTRDYVDGAGFARLMSEKGISRDTTLVLYGDRNNWWAAYALWVCTLFGHPDVRLLDGGRAKWIAEGRPLTHRRCRSGPRAELPGDRARRHRRPGVPRPGRGRTSAQPLIDVRSPGEYTGELLHMPDYPQEGALRGGHIPGAKNVPWARAAAEDATFRTRKELEAIYQDEAGLRPDDDVVVYCRIGERSSHTWFVLHHLLGYPHVRNYDGSWTEWGNAVRRAHPPRGDSRDAPAPSIPRLQEIADDFERGAGQGAAAAAAGVLRGAAAAARPVRRAPRPAGAGAGVPVAAVPGGRGGRRRHRAPVLRRAAGGADHPRLRRHPARRAGRAGRGRGPGHARASSPASSGCRTWSARCGCAAWPPCWPGSSARCASSGLTARLGPCARVRGRIPASGPVPARARQGGRSPGYHNSGLNIRRPGGKSRRIPHRRRVDEDQGRRPLRTRQGPLDRGTRPRRAANRRDPLSATPMRACATPTSISSPGI